LATDGSGNILRQNAPLHPQSFKLTLQPGDHDKPRPMTKRSFRFFCSSAFIAVAIAIVSTASCHGDTVWNTSLGDWFVAGNWTNGLPSANSTALINSGLCVISANASQSFTSQLVLGGSNTGQPAGLGVTNNSINTKGVIIGLDIGASGLLSLGSNSFLGVSFVKDLIVGDQGTGTLTASLGAEIVTTGAVSLGNSPGGSGSIDLNGSHLDSLNNFGNFDIGKAGSGSVSLSNGAYLSVAAMPVYLGRNGGTGSVTVAGSASLMQVKTLTVVTDSTMAVSDGGRILATTLNVGPGDINIGPNGAVDANTSTLTSDSRLNFTVAGSASGQVGRFRGQTLFLDGVFSLALAPGFSPAEGDRFSLLEWTSAANGQFDSVELPLLGSGLQWDTSTLYVNGSIQVVPEPGSGVCLSVGTCALAMLCRRRRERCSGLRERRSAFH
jgi:hypothetical protein